jgi:hypothetical protein
MKKKFPEVPIFAVVAENNIPSLRTFRKLGCPEKHVEGVCIIGGVNVLGREWPHPSSLFTF